MRICTTSIFVIIIYQTSVFTAPVNNTGSAKHGGVKTKFGKIADVIINPKWTLNDQNNDPTNTDTDPNNTNDVNDPSITNNDPDDSYNDKKRSKKNNNKNRRRKKSNNDRKRNNKKQNNTRRNGKYRWYKMVTVDYLLVNLPEYRNHEDEKKIILIWGDGDKRKSVLNENIDEIPTKNLNNNELIRKKRDYNNTFQLQDKLQNKSVKQHDSRENKKYKLNSEANTNNDHGQKSETQNNILENKQNKQNVKPKKTYKNIEKSGGHNSFEEDSSLIDNLEEDENNMDSNTIDNINENMKFLNSKNSNKNKFRHIIKKRKDPTNTSRNNQTYRNKLRRPNHAQHLGNNSSNNNSETERSYLKPIKQIPENVNETSTISDDAHEFTMKENADTAKNNSKLGKMNTFVDEINFNSVENQIDQNYESNSSSLESKQEIPNFRDTEDNTDHDILYNIRHPVKSKLENIEREKSADNKKPQKGYKKRIDEPLESNNINKIESHQKNIESNSPNPKDILKISYDEPKKTTEVNADMSTNTTEVDEIEKLTDEMNSNSDENLDDKNNDSFPFSLEIKQNIPNYSDVEDNKERDLLNNIRHPLRPKSKKLRKKLSVDNDKMPKIYKQKPATQLEDNNSKEKGSQQKSNTPLSLSLNKIPSKSNDVPKLNKGETTKIPVVDDIDTLMDEMNSYSDENLENSNEDSSLSSLETKQEIPNYSDIEDNKESDLLNNIRHPSRTKSKKINKQKPPTQLEVKNSKEQGPQQKSIEPLPLSLNEIPSKSNDVQKLTKGETTKIPASDDIDTLLDEMNSKSDENLEDNNENSSLSSLETKQEIPNCSDIEDNKESDLLNNIRHPSRAKSKKINKQKPPTQLEVNNSKEQVPQQKSIEPLPLSLNDIPSKTNGVPKLNKGETTKIASKKPGVDEIDTLINKINSNSENDDNNSGGMTMEYSDVKKNEDTTPSITKQQKNDLTKNNKSIPNVVDDKRGEQLPYINDVKHEKTVEENSNSKPISLVPTSITLPIAETELPTTAPLDENENIDRDSILRKVTQPKNVEPALDGDSDNDRNDNLLVPSIPKDEEEMLDSLNGNQEMNDLDHKSLSSSIDELLDSRINEDDSKLYPIDSDDEDGTIMGNNKESSQKPKEDKTTSKIPTIIEKKKSSEKPYRKNQSPHTTEQTIANNYDEPKNYRDIPSIVNPAKEVDSFDISDDYKNLGGMTMEYSDANKNEDTTPSITKQQKNDLTKNNKSIPNVVDDKKGEQLPYINDVKLEKTVEENSNDKPISFVPTSVTPPIAETELPTTAPLDENENIDCDSILRKVTQPKTVDPALDGDSDNDRNDNLLVPSIPKGEEEMLDSLNGNQEMNDLDHKSLSSSIDELLDSRINEDDSKLYPIDSDDEDATIMGNNKESSQKPKEDKTTSKIPTIIEKKKSSEKPYRKNQSPHTTEQTIPNNYDEPKNYRDIPSIVNPAKEVDSFDISDDYKNLGGMTMEYSDANKNEDTTPSITKQQKNDLTKNNKSIPNVVDDKRGEQLPYINDVKHEKTVEENSNGKPISLVPTSVTLPIAETELPTTAPLDENENIDRDSILRKVTQPKTVEPALDGDSDIDRNDNLLVPSIPKDEEEMLDSLNGNQEMNDLDHKSLSSSIDELLDSRINEDDSKLYPIDSDDEDGTIMGNNKESSQKPKEDKTTSKIPTIIEKKKSSEKPYRKNQSPHTTEQTIANNYDEPKNYRDIPSIVNPAKEVDSFDISDDYKNLGGMTMEYSDANKNEDTTPSITKQQKNDLTKKNKSIPNVVDDKRGEQLPYINDVKHEKTVEENSNGKPISLVPTSVTLPIAETELPTTAPLDENENIDRDSILRKVTQPKTVEPALDGDSDIDRNDNLLVPSIPKDEEEMLDSLNGNQEMNDLDHKSLSSSIDELLDSRINEDDSKLYPIDSDDEDGTIMGNNKESSQKPKEDKTTSKIPTIIEKKKSSEKPYRKNQSPHTTEQTIANNYDEPKNYRDIPSIVNPAKEVDSFDISDDYKNLGGMTMEYSDANKNEDTTPSITKQQKNDLTKNNKSIPNVVDDKRGEQLPYINDVKHEKTVEENSNDKPISLVPTSVTLPIAETELPTTAPLDENENIDRDSILRKVTQPKTVEPALDGDSDIDRNDNLLVPSIPKDEEEMLDSLNGNQEMNDLDHKSLSSSIDELLDSRINEDDSKLYPIDSDDEDGTIMGNNKESSQKPKEDKTTSKIPTIIEKKKSSEKPYRKNQSPHTTEQTIANKYDEPKNYSDIPSIVNPAKEVDSFDISDDYKNLGGMTMEYSDANKNEDTTPSITKQQKNDLTKKNKSIPNVVDDKRGEQLPYINDVKHEKTVEENSNGKPISLVPTSVTLPIAETELPTTAPLDENENIDRDSILRKVTQPKTVEPALDGDSDNDRNDNLLVPSIPNDEEEMLDSLNGNQEMNDLDYKSLSSSIDELLDSRINEDDSQLYPMDSDDEDTTIMGNNKECLQKPKEDKTTSKIPTVIEKKKSSEKPYRKNQSPHTTEQTIANNYDEPKNFRDIPSIVNPAKEVDSFDISDDYKNLGGMTMEYSDANKNEDTTPSITKQQKNDLTKNNKSIPNVVDDKRGEQLPYINDVKHEKTVEENSNGKPISLVPTSVTRPIVETELPTTAPLDENENIDRDSILRKVTQPKTVEPALDGDSDNDRNDNLLVPSIPKDEEEMLDSLNGNQEMNDLDYKSLSSSIDELLDSRINEDDSQLYPMDSDDEDTTIMGNNKECLQKPKEDKTTSKIPTVIEKKKSSEKPYRKNQSPHTTEQTIANNYDEPKNFRDIPSIVNPAKEVDSFDISDDYKNLGGMTMEYSDANKNEDTTPSITKQQKNDLTKNNKSIPNVVDDKRGEQLPYINDVKHEKTVEENSNGKPISLVPTSVTRPIVETELPTTAPLDENENIDRDSILRKVTQPKTVEPALDGDSDNDRNDNLLVPSIPKDEEEMLDSLNGNQEMNDLDYKSLSSSIDELLDSRINEDDSQLYPIDSDDEDGTIMGNNKECLQKPKEDKTTSKIPTIIEKKKSSEKPYRKNQSPHTTEQTIPNNYDEPKNYRDIPSIVNPAKEVDSFDISDDYKNLGGMTMEYSDANKNEDTTPSITKQQKNDLTKNNKSIPNVVDDKRGEQLPYINYVKHEKTVEENSNDKPISLVPTSITLPIAETELPTTAPLDENENIDCDSILRKVTQPKTVDPALDGDSDNDRNDNLLVPSIPKDEEEMLDSLNGNQEMNDLDHKSLSSSIDELLDSRINEDDSKLYPIDSDDEDATIMGNNKESSQKPKEDKTTSKIPTIIEKKKSSEKPYRKNQSPHTTEQTIANKYDEPKNYSDIPSIVNPAKEVDSFDISDDYKNLGGMTMEYSNANKNEDTTPSITKQQKNDLTENNKSIPNVVVDTIRPEFADINDTSNLPDEKLHEGLSSIKGVSYGNANDEISNEKSSARIPVTDIFAKTASGLSPDLSFDKNMNIDRDTILHKIVQPTSYESITGKPISIFDGDNGKNINLPIPSIDKSDVEIPKSVLSGNSQNTVSISNSGHNGFNPNSLNSNVSGLGKHILIPNKDEHSWVSDIIDQHKNNLLGLSREIYDHGNGKTKVIMDNSSNSNDLSESKNKNMPYNQIKQQNQDFLQKTHNNKQNNYENFKKFEKLLANDDSKVNIHDSPDSKYYDSNRMDKLTKIINVKNNTNHNTPAIMVSSVDNSPIISDYNLMNEYENPYGYMLPKFITKYVEGDDSNNNLWETVPPKISNVFTTHKESENFNNDINQSDGYNMKSRISNHVNNDKKVGIETEAVKNSYDDKTNNDIHNKLYDDFLKKMSEQLFKKIDNIDDKISKFEKSSNNGSYINYNIRSDYPNTKQIISMNDLPNSKPKNENNIEEPDSKTNKSVKSLETVISNKSNDENKIKEFTKKQKDKQKNHNEKLKKHSKHGGYEKNKNIKKNEIINNDSYEDDDDDDDNDNYYYDDDDDDDDDGKRKKKSHKKNYINHEDDEDDNGKHKKKSHKKSHINDDDDDDGKRKKKSRKKNHMNDDDDEDDNGKRKKKSHKKNYINDDDDDDGKRKKKSRKKNHMNDDDDEDDNGKRKKKSHKKTHINDDDDDDGKRKKKSRKKNHINDDDDEDDNGKHKKKSHKKSHINYDDNDGKRKKKSRKKNHMNDDDIEVSRSKKTDNKKKKKKKENTSPQECNEVNISTSLQISSENNDSIKGLKMKSKSKNFKKTNSAKSKKSVPKKKSKHKKQLKSFNYTNKKITVDASDKDSSSDENNYNLKKTYTKSSSNNNQNNALNEKKHKHKTHKKPLKTKKKYKYKEIPVNKEDNSSDENNVNLEETYNINITNDDKDLKQKRLRHKRLKKMKNIDINIVKDTDNQVLNKDSNTRQGYQFYAFYPQYRYTNPFGRLFY